MSDSNRRGVAALRGLLLALSVFALVASAALVWHWGATAALQRERAYPIANRQYSDPKSANDQTLANDARAAAAAEGAVEIALAQLVLSVLGLGSVGFTVFYAHLAWREAQRSAYDAQQAFVRAERPWLVLTEFELSAPLTVQPDRFRVLGRFKVKNVGRTIALNAFYNSIVVTERSGTHEGWRLRQEEEARRTLQALEQHSGGFVLAPGEELEGGFGANFSAEDLKGSIHPQDPGLYPFVLGTVTYRSPNDEDPHQTSFTLFIKRKNPSGSILTQPRILLSDGLIPIDEIEVVRFQSGYSAS